MEGGGDQQPQLELNGAGSQRLHSQDPASVSGRMQGESLAEMKKRRKEYLFYCLSSNFRIERDAQLLANRIALLKQEEMKTWKKIEETKKRTTEISVNKRRNEDKV